MTGDLDYDISTMTGPTSQPRTDTRVWPNCGCHVTQLQLHRQPDGELLCTHVGPRASLMLRSKFGGNGRNDRFFSLHIAHVVFEDLSGTYLLVF